jgi:hypothetical protein
MPRNLPQFTKCADPGNSYAIDGLSVAGMFFAGAIIGAIGGSVYLIVMSLLGQVATAGCVVGVGIYLLLIAGLLEFKDWYYNHRLMCIRHDQCACGTVVGQPHDGLDGDRKFEILIAPFDVPGTEQLLIEALVEMGIAGTLVNVPDAIDLQNRQVRFGYTRGLSEADQIKVYLNLVDNHMFNQLGRGYLRFLYRRVEGIMGTPAFTHSPPDEIGGSNPNPMFRVNPQEGADPEENVLVPYMHCELEGNRLARWLDNVLVGLIAGFAAFTAFCVLCEVITLGALDFLCGLGGALVSALIAFLAWLLSHLLNNPDDGVAGSPDVDVEDPDFDTPPSVARHGDVAYVFGDWVMDEEHDKYFEIHPIKAWYLLCQDNKNPDDWVLTEEIPANQCAFDVTKLTEDDFLRICKIVQAVENTDPDDTFTTTIGHGLSTAPR